MTQLKRLEVAGPQDIVSVFLSFPPSLSSSFLRADLFHGGKIVPLQGQSSVLPA